MVTEHPYRGCKVSLATAHGKAAAIAPVLKARLAIELVVPGGLDTDSLGTFSGEIPRAGTAGATLERKAQLGLEATDLTLGIASEGSYGPHPHFPFIGAGVEQMILIDTVLGNRVLESVLDDRPVFESAEVADIGDLTSFIEQSQFPSHAAVVQPAGRPASPLMFKGLQSLPDLERAVRLCAEASPDGRALVQTDMRDHMNPTRMRTIARLADRFANRLLSLCPMCDAPGYGRTGVVNGLKCHDCGTPTALVCDEIFSCFVCGEKETRPRSDGLRAADPRNCPDCNP